MHLNTPTLNPYLNTPAIAFHWGTVLAVSCGVWCNMEEWARARVTVRVRVGDQLPSVVQ